MKRTTMVLMAAVMLTGVLVTGCKKDNGPDEAAPVGVTNEEQAMQYFAKSDEFVANDEETFADKSIESFDYGTFGKVDAAITPLRWGRFVTSVTRTVTTTIQPGDTIAIAMVDKSISGTLKIRGVNGTGDTVTIEKPFNDLSKRNVIFKRVNRSTDRFWLNWVPVATSLVEGGTASPNNQIEITKLVLYVSTTDTITITDPNAYFLRYRWLKLFNGGRKDVPEYLAGQGLKLQVTVVSASADTDLVALRYGVSGNNHKRVRLALASEVNNGDGTYTRVFEIARTAPQFVHFHRGWFHMGIDAVTRATLMDDAAPYSVSWWGVPYRVF
ncbi:MAG: hypothetical protein IPI01_13165 [Ignavibacteriae bacterium]|nr:hypothetical protein [Ignavibacteriota bacterium]